MHPSQPPTDPELIRTALAGLPAVGEPDDEDLVLLAEAVAALAPLVRPSPDVLARIGPGSTLLTAVTHHGWKAAAMLTVGLGTWRVFDPPGAPAGSIPRSFALTPTSSEVWRDVLLVAAALATATLLMLWATRRTNKPE